MLVNAGVSILAITSNNRNVEEDSQILNESLDKIHLEYYTCSCISIECNLDKRFSCCVCCAKEIGRATVVKDWLE